MKGMIKIALVSAIATTTTGVQADLKVLDDSVLGDVTGQAGLTIDIETKRAMGEFAWKDGGSFLFQGFTATASRRAEELAFAGGNDLIDNLRFKLDVAGNGTPSGASGTPNNQTDFGFSDISNMAQAHVAYGNTDAGIELAAGVTTGYAEDQDTGLMIDAKKTYQDGDLVIHITGTDMWQKGGGLQAYLDPGVGGDDGSGGLANMQNLSYDAVRDISLRAIDYNYNWEALGIASSDYEIGSQGMETYLNSTTGKLNGTDHVNGQDATANTTVLLSGVEVDGYVGAIDIHIANNGNGFGADGSGVGGQLGSGNADSKITGDIYLDIEIDYYLDIAGVQLGMRLHNTRGDLSSMNRNATDTGYTSSMGMGHGRREIYAVKDTVLNIDSSVPNSFSMDDGLGYNTQYKGDFDIMHLSFGDTGTSIGEIRLTDIELTRNWVISAH